MSFSILFAWLTFLSAACVEPPGATGPRAESARPSIQLVETQPRRVAVIEHTGPYWSLGSAIDNVSRDARAAGNREGIVVRFLDPPLAGGVRDIRTEVGYFLQGMDRPRRPYRVAEWPIQLAVRKQVRGPDGLSTRHFASLNAWAQKEGLVPEDGMIALIQLAEDGASSAIEEAEILLPVCLAEPSEPEVPKKSAPSTAGPETNSAEYAPSQRVVTRVISLPSPMPLDTEESKTVDSPPVPVAAAPQVPIRGTQTPDVALDAKQAQRLTVRQWVDGGQFPNLAEALLPEKADTATLAWTDQVAARILAIAAGAEKNWPGDAGWLSELAAQLAARRKELKSNAAANPPPRVIGSSAAPPPHQAQRKALLLELDRLMAEISYKTLHAEGVRGRLLELLERAHQLVRS